MPHSRPLRLLQLTDLHLLGDADAHLRDHNPLRSLKRVLSHTRGTGPDWDAILLTGDLVNDDPAGYQHIRTAFGHAEAPVFCLPGNHDVPTALRHSLNEAPFQSGGSALLRSWLLVMLDSHLPGEASGHLAAAELAHLDRALSTHPDHHALVCLHHHPIESRSRWLDTVGLQNPEALFEVLDRHPQVRGLVWGHVHQASDTERRGVRLLGTPSTGVQFKPESADFQIDSRPPGYRWLELHADGTINSSVEWLTEDAEGAPTAADDD